MVPIPKRSTSEPVSDDMRRREFVTLLGGAAFAWPCVARAQAGKRLNIGVLGADATVWAPWMAAFVARLRELGWVEGHTIAIEYRWTEGSAARVSEIGADFLRQNVAVIVTYGGAVAVLKQATTVTPIVFAVAVDPVRGGLVASLARPGGNVTGMSIQQLDLVGKRLELLREVIPQFRRIAIMFDAGYSSSVLEASDIKATARTLGLDFASLEIRRGDDIPPTFEALKAKADALYVVSDALIATNRTRIITRALDARLPTILSYCDYVGAGGTHVLWPELRGPLPACRRHGRQGSARDETERHPGRAGKQIRIGYQSHDRQDTRLGNSNYAARYRR